MSLPKELLYTEEHEWVKKDGDTYVIGITDFAQDQLGDIVFVELPEVGDKIEQGDSIGSIESVKTVSDFYAPVTGEVVEINDSLEDEPELLNSDTYEKGWILKVKDVSAEQIDGLLSSEDYEKVIED
ncbi:glycine cleavage system protein H [Listeria fleischmannii 1991]|jgi:glycine cleavage system H protein|uniref:Glycine cleavage system H protein n=4 Tax=Listeria fleischmannii TaxID=1069827 RepID=A0A2X3GV15_9LIST|nr:glycine cleavage system protein GcvH [Listeria fleischmannii]EMG26875.1 glycine cleavage system protein H [Listeria fleischmannii subsp. fleischmannii LU2006-1]EUJ52262.1 glycine cleavage system protein H [Listeria fleischmannii FSL S10-1203]KMT59171.1 glycine cleavage system protein H [Listeria fleischmannii 1991]MBC1398722.1 glycine cleavage system protein GcvH [Listeria fleischmannii]MBC1418161.1 glycine cleavage system protein GcvH [Listeria fleischmannii]